MLIKIYRVKDNHDLYMLLFRWFNRSRLIFPNDGVFNNIDIFDDASLDVLRDYFRAMSFGDITNYFNNYTQVVCDWDAFLHTFEEVQLIYEYMRYM